VCLSVTSRTPKRIVVNTRLDLLLALNREVFRDAGEIFFLLSNAWAPASTQCKANADKLSISA